MANPTLREWLKEGSFTLALSSSFFGFYAHCGVATAFFENGFLPQKITGSSAGALVGGALASGLSPEAARELLFNIKRNDFWDPGVGLGYLRGQKFLEVLENNFVPTFTHATIPIEVAAFDLFSCKTRFLTDGSLPRAIVASCAVPVLFHPVRIGKKLFLDGGVFHKSGIHLKQKNERILCIFLQSDGLADSYEWGRSFGALGRSQKVLRLHKLPRVDYNSLEKGRIAFAEAYRRSLAALDAPLSGMVTDG